MPCFDRSRSYRLVPMWLIARGRGNERDITQRNLGCVGSKTILHRQFEDARRTEYERARLAASRFSAPLLEQLNKWAAFRLNNRSEGKP